MVEVFREVRRVLRPDGTLFVNVGDSYASGGMSNPSPKSTLGGGKDHGAADYTLTRSAPPGLKPKDLVGIPWRLAFALQADGWWLRSDIIWAKPNPMPESVTDRPTKAHEYVFLLAKSERYYYDAEAIRESKTGNEHARGKNGQAGVNPKAAMNTRAGGIKQNASFSAAMAKLSDDAGRNRRSVWTVKTQPYPEAHFATFPEDLIRPCILAGAPPGGIVFDPFVGSGTTVKVAVEEGRRGVGMDLSAKYLELATHRTAALTAPFPECA